MATFLGPAARYENLSDQPIRQIKVTLGKLDLRGKEMGLSPGQEAIDNYSINNKEDIYGTIVVYWQNADGKELTKQFELTEKSLPRNRLNSNEYIVFEFTQDNVEYYTSAAPDYWERGKKSAKIRSQIRLRN